MNFNFKGKVALITGGESGISASIAIALAKLGCQVIVTYFRKADLAKDVIKGQQICSGFLMFASSQNYITGTTHVVDGGLSIYRQKGSS